MNRTDLHDALNNAVNRFTRPVAFGLALLYALFVPGHLIFLASPNSLIMAATALFSSLLLFAYWFYSKAQTIKPHLAHPIAFVILSIALANSLLHLNLTQDIRQTTNILLIIVGIGSFILSQFWLLVFLAYASLTWLAVVLPFTNGESLSHYGFTFVSAIFLSCLIHLNRYQTFTRLESLRLADVTKSRQLEDMKQNAQYSEERFHLMAEASFDGIAILDESMILDANSKLLEMFGYGLDEIKRQPITKLIAEPVEAIPFDISVNESVSLRDLSAIHQQGHSFPVQIIGRTIPFSGQYVRVIAVRDVSLWQQAQSNLKNYQQELEQKNADLEKANRAKSAFLATMSHELRTPLTAIMGFAELLTDEFSDSLSNTQKNYVDDIYHAGQHLLAIINDILDLSRVEAGKIALNFSQVDLLELVKDAIRIVEDMASEKSISITVLSDELPRALLDYTRIKQVLYNYLSNAVKFTDPHGTVDIHISHTDEDFIIEVSDSGIGIAEEHQAQLFQPFSQLDTSTTRQFGGTGLGLALSKRLIDLHSGEVWVKSQLQQGSTFGFSIPKSIDKVMATTLAQPVESIRK